MTNEGIPLDEGYFQWLYFQIDVEGPTYWSLAKHLYKTPFYWSVRNDENRAEDGLQLREEYLNEDSYIFEEELWIELDCSVLEVLIALARRTAFESLGTPRMWFWVFIRNLYLDKYSEDHYDYNTKNRVGHHVYRWMDREYKRNGVGGIFPTPNLSPEEDQGTMELWFQMSLYLQYHRL